MALLIMQLEFESLFVLAQFGRGGGVADRNIIEHCMNGYNDRKGMPVFGCGVP